MKDNSFLKEINKPMIAMVHLAGLPGSVNFEQSLEDTMQRALKETRILVDAGFDAIMFQNTGDVPASEEGDEATVACMTAIGQKIREICPVPLGINVLMNGSKASFAIAKAISAEFVRVKINTGAVVTITGTVEAMPYEVRAFQNRIQARDVTVLGDIYDRTSAPLGAFPLPVLADLSLRHGGSDALVISGYDTTDTQTRIKEIRKAIPSAFLITGGGSREDNLHAFMEISDAVIVGSSIKTGGKFLDPVDPAKAKAFMQRARTLRGEQ